MADPIHKPTELGILNAYLLSPSSLPTIVALPNFTLLLPAQHRTHPHIRTLYRDLQFQRSVDVDGVRSNVKRETSRGIGMRAKLQRAAHKEMEDDRNTGSRKRRRMGEATPSHSINDSQEGEGEGAQTDILLDTTLLLSGDPNNLGMVPRHSRFSHHTLPSLLSAMETACQDLQTEVDEAEAEAERILAEMRETVGALSDLRYGKFARMSGADADGSGGLEKEVTKGLRDLVGVCD